MLLNEELLYFLGPYKDKTIIDKLINIALSYIECNRPYVKIFENSGTGIYLLISDRII